MLTWQDPVLAFTPFASDPGAALLHSSTDNTANDGRSRWSYIAASPFRVIKTDSDLNTTIDDVGVEGDPFEILKSELNAFPLTSDDAPSPFLGGTVGFLSYELARAVEDLPKPKPNSTSPKPAPALVVGLYDVIAAFDHDKKEAWILSSGYPAQATEERQRRAVERAQWLQKSLEQTTDPTSIEMSTIRSKTANPWKADATKVEVESRIAKVRDYIYAGDIFQANITQRFSAALPEDTSAWNLFQSLQKASPAPFSSYLNAGQGFHLASASPERFLRVDRKGGVETRPIKGSRPRGATPAEDQAFASALTTSAKDVAENLMIVDLMRNDLSRVCENGSVQVPVHCGLETFASIHHLVSVITGQLRPGATAVDLLRACFPGGSVTGAPKVRAMEVIHELEPVARGPYCGSVIWIGFDGAMDSSIIIRSLVVSGDTVWAQAGGGIVSDSDPAQEYEESMVKVRPLLAVLAPDESP